ncbi:GlxA family transcriptional regulator [Pseudomonas sp. CFBP 8770]|uniref:GlxA family transcriptional regulator n=1 Tax=unclassified Pseudomonas TaxID=196821 RepID=UPI00178147A9|nr:MULTISPECIES: GlxA family transcriptional regulator [unclassified Pseudomonas]MBD8472521.1 GlxA family transcriptional regulator [Pseudomonas sp. CFBP 8773]MBD8649310.1 GlxA family transcriptional regulator [Pseudomonas sp. CFBP 8770]
MTQRIFSGAGQSKNLLYLASANGRLRNTDQSSLRVGFVLLEHFSLAAFTASLDTLVTANLISPAAYAIRSYGLAPGQVISDLGILLQPDAPLMPGMHDEVDLLIICGGFRTPLRPSLLLSRILADCARRGIALGGLWNGAWFLGQAGLLDGYRCAVHPENRASLAELSPQITVTPASQVIDRDRATAASPNGGFGMMMEMIRQQRGDTLASGVEHILAFEGLRFKRTAGQASGKLSQPLRNIIDLMESNLEEPLSLDQLAEFVGRSRRQIDRLFQDQLGTSPHRYYMELRVTEARRLLQHSTLSIMDVAIACGFVSVSHFSKCYSGYFGHSPSRETRLAE